MPQAPSSPTAGFVPLSVAEQRQLRLLLYGISSRTLLLSLLELTRGSQDADLIIAALLDRLPFDGDATEHLIEPPPTCP